MISFSIQRTGDCSHQTDGYKWYPICKHYFPSSNRNVLTYLNIYNQRLYREHQKYFMHKMKDKQDCITKSEMMTITMYRNE